MVSSPAEADATDSLSKTLRYGRLNGIDGEDYEFIKRDKAFLLRKIQHKGSGARIYLECTSLENNDYRWIPRQIETFHPPGWKKGRTKYGPFTVNYSVRADISVRLTSMLNNYGR